MQKIDARTLTKAQKKTILERDDYICGYCYGEADEVDHIIPWSFRHDDSEDNLIAACWLCNLTGANKVFDTFKEKQEDIQDKRYKWIKRNPIPLWLKEEIDDLGYGLKDKVVKTSMIFNKPEELEGARRRLLEEGYRVLVG